jgi:hypothetical protein
MAIDFNKQLVFDPKIDIVGEEVPLAEMEKTGQVLQGRYDKSYEDYSTFKELAKQTEQISDREEREKVKEYIKDLEPQVKQISEKGDFHNMRQQTAALAKNAAFNLKLFGERAAEIKKYRDLIAANDKIGDEETKAYYQNKLNKTMAETQYNPETKSFNFSALQLPKMVEDYDSNKLLQNATQGWLADTYKDEAANLVVLKAGDKIPGVGGTAPVEGVYNTKTGRQTAKVDFNEIYNNVLKIAKGERGLQAMLQRDFEIKSEGKNLNPKQQEALKQSLKRKYLYDPLTGFANKAANETIINTEDLTLDKGATDLYNAGLAANADNGGIDDTFESTINPGESSPLVANLTANPEIKKPAQGAGNQGKFEFKNKTDLNSAKLVFSGLSIPNLKKMQSGTPEQQALANALIKDKEIYGIYNDIMAGKPVNNNSYNNIMAILQKNNYVPPTSYKWVSTSDKRLINELVKEDPSVMTANGIVDTEKAQQILNRRLFGKNEGLVIDKDGNFTSANAEGLDIMDPETGEVLPFNEAYKQNKFELKSGNLFDNSRTIQVNGKVKPGSLAHAHSENPQQDLSYFGAGYTINSNGKQYIVAKRGEVPLNSSAAKLNDLASFSRFSRDEKQYRTSDGQPVKVKSDFSGNVIITYNGKSKTVDKDLYNATLQRLGDADVKNPIDYLPQFELFKP